MDFKTPTLPLSRPTRDRLAIRAGKVRERPKQSIENASPNKPISTTGLRPILSESLTHWRTKSVSTRKNVDSCPDQPSGCGVRTQEKRAYYDSSIVPGSIFVSLRDPRFVYQLKNEGEN